MLLDDMNMNYDCVDEFTKDMNETWSVEHGTRNSQFKNYLLCIQMCVHIVYW
jgi:hypothetical protein